MKSGGKNVSSKKSNPNFQTAEFQLGYLYRDIETQLNTFGTTNGGAITAADAARWVGTLLLTKAGGHVLDGPEPLPNVRGGSAERHEVSIAAPPVHVRSRHDKAPVNPFEEDSVVGRAFELAQKGMNTATLKRFLTATKKKKHRLSRKARKAISDAQKARWAKVNKPRLKDSGIKGWCERMTPEQRRTEMARRMDRRAENERRNRDAA